MTTNPTFSMDELQRLLLTDSVEGAAVDIAAAADTPFQELGYDSLAMLELVCRVGREYGVSLPEDAEKAMTTPNEAVRYIGRSLADARLEPGLGRTA
ncbi:acyl carrier protein [Streptomyces armeniacus]|uniref:Acyl carrier protein n=1 Tax=Streptomyces armeniacus TaxID=83291 RepID=A0A345XLM3_9ACTN|nr:acyl carrier protein [Streptomyces armeniacus]AXK32539.1 acyl carrier protein [Streptomyces armeniacus]